MVDLLLRGDVSAFNSLLEELPEPCAAHPSGVGSPPPCPTGVPDGGTVNTFRYISCERGYPGEQQRELIDWILKQRRKLYAVFQPKPGTLFTMMPKGEYSLVFMSETPRAEQLGERYEVRGGRLIGMWLACGPGLDTVRRMTDDVANWVVAPQVALPTQPRPAGGPDGYPLSRRTGIRPGPDIVLDALESGIPERILAHFSFYPIGCITTPTGSPQPPFCRSNEPAGTPVQVFPMGGCGEGSFQTREMAIGTARGLADPALRVWAIYQQTSRAPTDVYEFPLGSQVIVLSRTGGGPQAQAVALQIEGGNILSVRFACGFSAGAMIKDVAPAQFLLPPPR